MNIKLYVDARALKTRKFRQSLAAATALPLLALVCSLSLAPPGYAAATQEGTATLEKVRDIETDSLVEDVTGISGTAFAPGLDAVIVRKTGSSSAATLQLFSPARPGKRPRGTRRPTMSTLSIADPINLTYDGQMMGAKGAGLLRVFALDPATQQLAAIRLRADGTAMAKPVTFGAAQYQARDPQGLAFDPGSGSLFILDNSGPQVIRIASAKGRNFDGKAAAQQRRISEIPLPSDVGQVRGIAFQPITKHLFILSETNQSLDEFTLDGQRVSSRSLVGSGLKRPTSMVIAPSLDQTDADDIYHLYTVEPQNNVLVASEYRLGASPVLTAKPNALAGPTAAPNVVATLVQTMNMAALVPPSADTGGAVYLPFSNSLLFTDSEINEIPALFTGKNLFETSLTGQLLATYSTLAYSMEPTGIDLNPANRHLFISDDDRDRINEINPGSDGLYNTGDDVNTWFTTRPFSSNDPEEVAFAPSENALFILDGFNAEVYRLTPGANGKFDGIPPGGDDQLTQFDTESQGLTDPEGLTFDPDSGLLYLVGFPKNKLFQFTTSGAFVRMVDISAVNPKKPAGLGVGPSSLGASDPNPAALNVYMAARGVDNDYDPSENDGKVYELSIPPLPPTGNTNVAPTVSAGPDQSITLPAGAILDGSAADDGMPNPPGQITVNWTQVSGPGAVTFGNPTSVNTSAVLSDPGVYVLRLTANDGGLSSSDDIGVTVAAETPSSEIRKLYVTNTVGGTVGGVSLADEDIIVLDLATNTWSLFFDGSDVGLGGSGTEINAFTLNADGSILLSFTSPVSVPGLGTVGETDIVRFIPTSTGTNTAGSYELYFRGANVGLTSSAGDIDVIAFAPDGRLLLSTTGTVSVPGASGSKDEDLLAFTATQLGSTTSGTFALYFDGSDVQLDDGGNSEDVTGAWVDDNGEIYLSTYGNFSVTGASGTSADLFVCTPGSIGSTTSCSFRMYFEGALHGLSGKRLGGIYLAR